MPDIVLRFHKDMLVMSAPVDTVLARQGVDIDRDREFITLVEPEAVRDAYRMESIAGAQCLVTNTAGITYARLAKANLEDRARELAVAALTAVSNLHPQHVLIEIGPTGLPLDESSANSLKQNRDQYAQAVDAFAGLGFDAFFLTGMTDPADMRCALMGAKKQSDAPVFASVSLTNEGMMRSGKLEVADVLAMMADLGADAVGFETGAPIEQVIELIEEVKPVTYLPIIVSLSVGERNHRQQQATDENPYFCPDTLISAAAQLRGAGVQFLRATGQATPAYTGALVAASAGFDVVA